MRRHALSWGLLFLIAGVSLLAENLGLIKFEVWKLWPLILIWWGLTRLYDAFRLRE
jgi:hypothetical protein